MHIAGAKARVACCAGRVYAMPSYADPERPRKNTFMCGMLVSIIIFSASSPCPVARAGVQQPVAGK